MTLQTVSELNQSIKLLLENGFPFISVVGEISNLRKPYSGHIYFTLKDSQSQVRAVLFRVQQRYISSEVTEGTKFIIHGRISLYEPRGEYQIIVDRLEPLGAGALQLAFEQLKQNLSREGLFDKDTKKTLPLLPSRISLVTSPSGAAVFDFITRAQTRCPSVPIDIYPVSVQGDGAAKIITQTLLKIDALQETDLIVLCRGGGSIEDLWPFNDESLARTIASLSHPIVSAIGHEIDWTIADFVSDVRAPTPTAAAEIAVPDRTVLQKQMSSLKSQMTTQLQQLLIHQKENIRSLRRILGSPQLIIESKQLQIDYALSRLSNSVLSQLTDYKHLLQARQNRLMLHNPGVLFRQKKECITNLKHRLIESTKQHLAQKKEKVKRNKHLLGAMNPLAILERGYCLARLEKNGDIVHSVGQTKPGDLVSLTLQNGSLLTKVESTSNEPDSKS